MGDDESVTVSVRFPRKVLDASRAQAAKEERAWNTVVIRALKSYLESPPKEKKGAK